MKKRLLSWLLVLALCLSLLPAAALAEDAPEQTDEPTIVEQTEAPVAQEQTEEPAVQVQTESVQAVNETAVQTAAHSHPICGAEHTNIGDHTADNCEKSVTWLALTQSSDGELYAGGTAVYHYKSEETAVTAYDFYKLTEGSYYLGGDITINAPIRIEGSVNLCLNGYSITKTTDTPYTNEYYNGVITIMPGGSFSLCDCRGGGIRVSPTHSARRYDRSA